MRKVKPITYQRLKNSLQARKKTYKTRLRAKYKDIRKNVVNLGQPKGVIWIFGCQRSGTTFLENIFRHDLNSVVYGEFSELSIASGKTVLQSIEEIKRTIQQQNAKYAVIRPLFESDRANELLDVFPNSVGVWLYRDNIAVIDSMIRKWDNRFFDISRKVESDLNGFWRLEESINKIKKLSEAGNTGELYTRFWLMRNKLALRPELLSNKKLIRIEYNQLVHNPEKTIKFILSLVGIPEVWRGFKQEIKEPRTRDIKYRLPEALINQCDNLYNELKKDPF